MHRPPRANSVGRPPKQLLFAATLSPVVGRHVDRAFLEGIHSARRPSRKEQVLVQAQFQDIIHAESQDRLSIAHKEALGRKLLVEITLRSFRETSTPKSGIYRASSLPPPASRVEQSPTKSLPSPLKSCRRSSWMDKVAACYSNESLNRQSIMREEHEAWCVFSTSSRVGVQPTITLKRRNSSPVIAPDVKSSFQAMGMMIELANFRPGDVVYDVGCGDGELLSLIAAKYPLVSGIGIEIRKNKVKEARVRLAPFDRFVILESDALEVCYERATVVLTYMTPIALKPLRRRLERDCKPGTRVISLLFPIPGWKRLDGITQGVHKYIMGNQASVE